MDSNSTQQHFVGRSSQVAVYLTLKKDSYNEKRLVEGRVQALKRRQRTGATASSCVDDFVRDIVRYLVPVHSLILVSVLVREVVIELGPNSSRRKAF